MPLLPCLLIAATCFAVGLTTAGSSEIALLDWAERVPITRGASNGAQNSESPTTSSGCLHFPYMTLTVATRGMPILRSMRKPLVCLALLALLIPVGAVAAIDAGDGTLSVEDGRGKVNLEARGGVIGRLDRGTLTVSDKTPGDSNFPVVTGADQPEVFLADGSIRYRGTALRFRVIGGGFKLQIQGRGIDLSVVGKGSGFIEGETYEPGVYSLDGSDCRKSRSSCASLPQPGIRFKLGAASEKNSGRPGSD